MKITKYHLNNINKSYVAPWTVFQVDENQITLNQGCVFDIFNHQLYYAKLNSVQLRYWWLDQFPPPTIELESDGGILVLAVRYKSFKTVGITNKGIDYREGMPIIACEVLYRDNNVTSLEADPIYNYTQNPDYEDQRKIYFELGRVKKSGSIITSEMRITENLLFGYKGNTNYYSNFQGQLGFGGSDDANFFGGHTALDRSDVSTDEINFSLGYSNQGNSWGVATRNYNQGPKLFKTRNPNKGII